MLILIIAIFLCVFPFFPVVVRRINADLACISISIGIIMLIACLTIAGESYSNYIQMKQIHGQIMNNYQEAIEIYENKAVIDTESLTDFRYKGYQESVSSLIKDLRKKTVKYNRYHIGKTELNSNIIFNWLIIAPDKDMKLLSLNE